MWRRPTRRCAAHCANVGGTGDHVRSPLETRFVLIDVMGQTLPKLEVVSAPSEF